MRKHGVKYDQQLRVGLKQRPCESRFQRSPPRRSIFLGVAPGCYEGSAVGASSALQKDKVGSAGWLESTVPDSSIATSTPR
jgi:hypothetical protein